MQTFVPEQTYGACAYVLDNKRLGKQRVECKQIYLALTLPKYGWKNHPATKMWRGCETGLLQYAVAVCHEWRERGFNDTMLVWFLDQRTEWSGLMVYPEWWGGEIHRTHQSNLIRKDPVWYSQHGWEVDDSLPYYWPVV
jgi:hypothetical protein